MKVNEARFNNLVNFKFKGVDYGNVMIDKNYFSHYENKDYEYTSIPLTEEWLVKFGFTKITLKNGDWFVKSECDIDYCFKYRDFKDDFTFYVEYTDSPFENDKNRKHPVSFGTKHVHQLQNLYLDLTRKELIL